MDLSTRTSDVARAAGPGSETSSERGAVAVLVALLITAAIVFLAFVIDIGNGFYHHRHLQLQADAAALAGGAQFATATSCTDSAIVDQALQYAGVAYANISSNTNWTSALPAYTDPAAPFNSQVGGTAAANIYSAINSKTYLPAGNNASPDPTNFASNSPCSDSMLDVKMTETNLPWYFQAGGFSYINAHARVTWGAVGSGLLPLAVDETAPLAAEAYFVNEATGTVLAQVALTNSHSLVGGGGTYAGDDIWTSTPVGVPITSSDVGVEIALSGDPTTTDCTNQAVTCFNQSAITTGDDLVHIQGYSNAPAGSGSITSPGYRSVTLSEPNSAGCAAAPGAVDTGGAAYYSVTNLPKSNNNNCNVVVNATVDLGTNPNLSGVTVKASLSSKGNQPTSLTLANGVWSGTLTVPDSNGPNDVYLAVCSGNGQGSCTTWTKEQATFTANDDPPNGSSTSSGPIDEAVVSSVSQQNGNVVVTPEADSLPKCDQYTANCTVQLEITAAVSGNIQDAASVNDPVFALNFGTNNTASQTGDIECPPGTNSGNNLGNTILSGCPGNYVINYSPNTNTFSDPSCNNTNPTPGPADCVQAKNGVAQGQVDSNLYCRFVGGPSCVTPTDPTGAPPVGKWYCPSPNGTSATSGGNWSSFQPNPPYFGLPRDDDRIIQLFITPYNAFVAAGATGRIVPIEDVADFYVMGWTAPGQNADPCGNANRGTGDYASEPSSAPRIWGHFIRYTTFGHPGPLPCSASGLGGCAIALTQ